MFMIVVRYCLMLIDLFYVLSYCCFIYVMLCLFVPVPRGCVCLVQSKLVKLYQSRSVITQGRFARDIPPLLYRLLVTTCYGVSIVAEQEHVRKSWTSHVKHPMLRLSQNVTTLRFNSQLSAVCQREFGRSYLVVISRKSFGRVRPIPVLTLWISGGLTQA